MEAKEKGEMQLAISIPIKSYIETKFKNIIYIYMRTHIHTDTHVCVYMHIQIKWSFLYRSGGEDLKSTLFGFLTS